MLNLLVSLLNDLYEELKSLAKADWCRAQVRLSSEGKSSSFPTGMAHTRHNICLEDNLRITYVFSDIER